ncbi:MAG: hypothetical protein M3O46_02870 [Myxococcota bacterium]|nr:hypothetical protein [Myxococcota bacterium]
MCITDGNTHFQFNHDPSTIYYSPDIDTGISTVTPAPGDTFNATVRIHSEGVAGNGEVALCVCPPGTSITSILNHRLLAVPSIPACDPLNPTATTSAILSWTVPSGFPHFCLAAMVKDTALGAPDYDSPIVQPTPGVYQFSTPFNPYNTGSAQFNVSLVQGGQPAPPPPGPPPPPPGGGGGRWCTNFAFAVGNPLREDVRTQIVAYPIRLQDEKIIAALSRQSQIAAALELGRFQSPRHTGLAVGRERVLPRPPRGHSWGDDDDSREKREEHGAMHSHLGHWGVVTEKQFNRLAVTPVRPEHTMNLVVDEVRQGLVHICAPDDARPGDLFGVDIRHELLRRSSHEQQRILGGLVVILRIPHRDDPKGARREKHETKKK